MFTSTTPTTITHEDRELQVLSVVHEAGTPEAAATEAQAPKISQRSIAEALGMSVGLTNAILKRLTEKGFLMMRRINAHNVHYLVTPAGIDQISRRSYLYLRRTIGHVVRYKERLREFCHTQRERGIRHLVLIGESDLTFILEWCAEKEGLGFRVVTGLEEGNGKIEPEGSAGPMGSEDSLGPDRGGGEKAPPRRHGDGIVPRTSSSGTTLNRAGAGGADQVAHAGVVYLLSELHPELSSQPGEAPSAAIPLHEIVLGKR